MATNVNLKFDFPDLLAKNLLAKNQKNRPVKDSYVKKLANMMKNGVSATIRSYFILKSSINSNFMNPIYAHGNEFYYKFYLENEDLIYNAVKLALKCYNKNRTFSVTEIASFFLYLNFDKGYSQGKINSFFNMAYLFDSEKSPATDCLTAVLFQYTTGSSKMTPRYKRAILVKAWNAFITSSNIKMLKFNIDNDIPEVI